MEPSQKTRIQTSINDLEDIQMISTMMWESIESFFRNNEENSYSKFPEWIDYSYDTQDWPKKIQFALNKLSTTNPNKSLDSQTNNFQIITSNMGSVTLRPLDAKKYPIFYMSLTKYSDSSYLWEDENGNRMETRDWQKYFSQAINNYFA
ncbi:hypothetical protein [Leptospira sp. GIMC2001]|uniref:hypothetical protein n=1 Tax=Leptospira sp. GIMC2001 TaxID=1513297 RepID=UPI002348F9F8|nr:hypothetical protein [Leptospira sp. GIMC2001]WCL50103.1 hypothetical protein O4O04_04600 [Leptospira sp. GIMC2001]